jgi:hypothetical protein
MVHIVRRNCFIPRKIKEIVRERQWDKITSPSRMAGAKPPKCRAAANVKPGTLNGWLQLKLNASPLGTKPALP